MVRGLFCEVAAAEQNAQWANLIHRQGPLYSRENDIRSEFARDYTRILHCCAYRRLKHKTQVFFNIRNDHICTRMEHVAHVESVSTTIGAALGLNIELIRAIAMGHDVGHAPFGHHGEEELKKLSREYLHVDFWHEKNGLRFVDKIELLENNQMVSENLDLTYAVRDGIVAHCGEIDENGIRPRNDFLDLGLFEKGKAQPVTWEACVVKISDKIAYVGRDIEDANRLGFLTAAEKSELLNMARLYDKRVLNTTVIIYNLINDICENSSPTKGICLSENAFEQLNKIKGFNGSAIYNHPRLLSFKKYASLIIDELFRVLYKLYDGEHTIQSLDAMQKQHPLLVSAFLRWMLKYVDSRIIPDSYAHNLANWRNEKLYNCLETKELYAQAIIDYISGMTDRYAIETFNELITF